MLARADANLARDHWIHCEQDTDGAVGKAPVRTPDDGPAMGLGGCKEKLETNQRLPWQEKKK